MHVKFKNFTFIWNMRIIIQLSTSAKPSVPGATVFKKQYNEFYSPVTLKVNYI